MDIGVIGGGTAGNAAAILLARAGHAVTVYERVTEPLPVGAGIVLQPSGLAVLHRLGLYDAVVARGSRLKRLHAVTATGRTVIDLGYEEVMPGAFGLGIHRGVLFDLLFRAARAEPNVRFHCGVWCRGPADDRGRRQAIEAGTGRALGTHDLIVVADGARSRLRRHGRAQADPALCVGALWFIGDGAPGDTLHQVAGHTAAARAAADRPQADGRDAETTLFWSIRCDRVEAGARGGARDVEAGFLRLAESAPLLEQIVAPEQVLHRATSTS
jgi:2-polyprenyl-6-methoxyphenol hydroxylase-like FAD-dependent oxidoreductase